MREILFRAKKINSDKWVEGSYVYFYDVENPNHYQHRIYLRRSESERDGNDYHFYPDYEIVDKKSICQFTGLTDINGTKIYEKDILGISNKAPVLILYDNDCCCFMATYKDNIMVPLSIYRDWPVIGNAFDNQELLKSFLNKIKKEF